jgi:hypothetical protein
MADADFDGRLHRLVRESLDDAPAELVERLKGLFPAGRAIAHEEPLAELGESDNR